MPDSRELSISAELVSELEGRASDSNFKSVDAYAEYILEEVLHQLDDSVEAPDESDVQERLQSLGYVE